MNDVASFAIGAQVHVGRLERLVLKVKLDDGSIVLAGWHRATHVKSLFQALIEYISYLEVRGKSGTGMTRHSLAEQSLLTEAEIETLTQDNEVTAVEYRVPKDHTFVPSLEGPGWPQGKKMRFSSALAQSLLGGCGSVLEAFDENGYIIKSGTIQ